MKVRELFEPKSIPNKSDNYFNWDEIWFSDQEYTSSEPKTTDCMHVNCDKLE